VVTRVFSLRAGGVGVLFWITLGDHVTFFGLEWGSGLVLMGSKGVSPLESIPFAEKVDPFRMGDPNDPTCRILLDLRSVPGCPSL
jgi:hypothetical protein